MKCCLQNSSIYRTIVWQGLYLYLFVVFGFTVTFYIHIFNFQSIIQQKLWKRARKMENSSTVKVFTLSGLQEAKPYRSIYFSFTLFIYLLIILVNLTLILIIFLERELHDPMYILLSHLCINGLYGTAGFYPKSSWIFSRMCISSRTVAVCHRLLSSTLLSCVR